eukprot:GHVR01136507.1.p1 GENE.GHVR01136507.1~~GHVR01136507.1.p1  ORF type:complete len:171 (+),score=28.52 GHVR01136507.1:3-515(+)
MRDLQVGKSKDIRELIASRIDMWEAHRYDELLEDAETCARALARAKKGKTPTSEEELVRKFSRLMWLGNTRAAVRLVTEENTGGILEMNDEVFKNLQAKHPSQATPPLTALLQHATIERAAPHGRTHIVCVEGILLCLFVWGLCWVSTGGGVGVSVGVSVGFCVTGGGAV